MVIIIKFAAIGTCVALSALTSLNVCCVCAWLSRCAPGYTGDPTIPGETCERNNGTYSVGQKVIPLCMFAITSKVVQLFINFNQI